MSGTSMDGIDAALVRLTGPHDELRVRLLASVTVPYPSRLRRQLLGIAGGEHTTAEAISQLNFLLGDLFAEAALKVCRRAAVSPQRLSVIGSHGQTVFHQGFHQGRAAPPQHRPSPLRSGVATGRASTLQIGEPAVIAERTGAPVVADFRTADVAAGGQGAPLVPLVDYLLLRDARQGAVALNIGGIANVTLIPAGARPEDVLGFDTGPGNMVMDALVRSFTKGRKTYDAGGRLAARGKVLGPLLAEALGLPFFKHQPPKSAGREQFGERFVSRYFLRPRGARSSDLLRTATELTARSIADALRRFALSGANYDRLIVSGGGAHNRLLLRRLGELLPRLRVDLSDKFGLPVDAKEAIAFAVLADRTLHGLPGNLPSVTGARRAVVLGKIVRP
jgi:anhydro-N-acetylmuramic acid kinase